MKHKINPIVDCVFKALLGSEKNKNLLIHFLNAVTGLQGDDTITDVVITNPYNEREFIDDKLSIVDIMAKCQNDFKYQVEIQLAVYPALPSRVVYNWSTIYHSQLTKKGAYSELKPVFSIWILDSPLFKDANSYHLEFGIHDSNHNISLTNHLRIHLLQLSFFDENKNIGNETERWLYFFKKAEEQDINNLPDVLKTKEMIQAMETLQDFSENQKNYLLYQSRFNAQLERNTWEKMMSDAEKKQKEAEQRLREFEYRQRKEAEQQRKEAEQQRKEAEQQRKEAEQQRKEAVQQRKEADEKLKTLMIELESEHQEKEKERQEKESILKEKELYLKILKEKGIDIDLITKE